MNMNPNGKSRLGRTGPSFAIAAITLIAACFSFVSGLKAAQQSDQEIFSILTTGQWRLMETGRMFVRVFNTDGTFSTVNNQVLGARNRPSPSADQGSGTWKIAGEKVILSFSNGDDEQEILLPINPRFARCVDQKGVPMMMVKMGPIGIVPTAPTAPLATPSATPSVSSDDQRSAAQVVQAYHNSLVFVRGKEGAGSGFIAAIGKANFLVTNVHVVAEIEDAAFKTLDGTVVQGGAASMAVGEDVFCMALPQGGKPFEVMQGVDSIAAIGDSVVVLGNAEGAGVVNTITGKIVGIGPDLVETDAPFVPGNSGSPIVHLKTGKVIGVATYLITNQYDLATDRKLKDPIVRRFGYRIDSVKAWQPVNWQVFSAQAAQMKKIERLTDDLYDFFRDLDENKGRITPDRHTNPILKTRIDEWLEAKGHNHSEEDRAEADANLVSFLKISCQSDVTTALRQMSYDYFRRDIGDQAQARGEMAKAFEEILENVRQ